MARAAGNALESNSVVFAALEGAGRDAAQVIPLFAVMAIGSAVIWLVVTALALHGARGGRARWSERAGLWLIAVGGFVVPALVLAALLAYGMPTLARQLDDDRIAAVRLTVAGEQWWWRVRYELPGGGHVDLANEIRLPRDRVAAVTLTSTNVIHSFWIPPLAGKMDMIPGRVTRLMLEPTAVGTYRGVCAEYCGASHARMAFAVEVMEPEAFDRWLLAQAGPAATGAGASAFIANGCGACHAIRGTPAAGVIGPDLTHVGGRLGLAAASLPNTEDDLARWIARPDHVKPGVLMPPFGMLAQDEVRAMAVYLRALQ
jgi:cytochrome c oxidase subunit 2